MKNLWRLLFWHLPEDNWTGHKPSVRRTVQYISKQAL